MKFNLAETLEQEDAAETAGMNDVQRAVRMGNLMAAADKEVQRLATELADAQKRFNKIAMNDIPELLREIGLSSIELTNGAKIEVKQELSTSITQANHELAMKWLVDNSFGGIIKTNVTVAFSAEEQEEAAQFAAQVSAEHDGVTYKAAVHPATLKSFVKERLAAGDELPLDLFSVYEYHIAKLTQPKEK